MRPLTLGFLTVADAAPPDIVSAAAGAGFEAVSLRITGRRKGDPWFDVLGPGGMLEDIRRRADQTGIQVSNISGYYVDGEARLSDAEPVLDATVALGAPLIVQGCFDPVWSRLVETLGRLAGAAHARGLKIGIEFMPASEVKTLPAALQLLAEVQAPNLGLVIDSLHLARSGSAPEALDAIDPTQIYLAQICDGFPEKPAEMTFMEEALKARFYPGEGGLPLADFVAALPPAVEIECETPCIADAGLPLHERAKRARNAARSFLAGLAER